MVPRTSGLPYAARLARAALARGAAAALTSVVVAASLWAAPARAQDEADPADPPPPSEALQAPQAPETPAARVEPPPPSRADAVAGETEAAEELQAPTEDESAQGAEGARPAPAPELAAPPEAAMAPPPGLGFSLGKSFHLTFDGYVRAQFTTIQPDRFFFFKMPADAQSANNPYAGRNDGFALADARINLNATYEDILVRIGIDGSVATFDDSAEAFDMEGSLRAGLADAYFQYSFHPAARLSVGRFKPPFDVEQLLPVPRQFFVHRALESVGVSRHQGFFQDQPGFNQGRQIGIMLSSPDVLDMSLFQLGYGLAVTNGNRNAAFNDNDLPAFYGRVELGLKFGIEDRGASMPAFEGPATYAIREGILLGASFMYNEVTSNPPPNRQLDRVWGAGVDLSARWAMIIVQGQFLYQETERLGFSSAARELAMGGHVQASVEILDTGLAPGYRFAAYDPRIPQVDQPGAGPDDDFIMHHTVGVRWAVPSLPLVTYLEYTRSVEQGARAFNNDRIELAAQVTFE